MSLWKTEKWIGDDNANEVAAAASSCCGIKRAVGENCTAMIVQHKKSASMESGNARLCNSLEACLAKPAHAV